jgi:CheY-like chemotaxis protein
MAFRTGVLARTAATPLRTELPQQPGGRLRLLHVEDNPADALLAQSYIRGVIPDVEFDRAACLGDVTSESATAASCAILDLSLPDASGLEALQSLRGMSEQLPIVVLTGFDDIQIGLSAIRNGAEDYLLKNFVDADGLQRAIRYAIERRRLRYAQGVQTTAQVAPRPVTVDGTHQVAIRIDPESGMCLLQCQTCSWQAERGCESLSSWGFLERAILPHAAFGAVMATDTTSDDDALPRLTLTAGDIEPGGDEPDPVDSEPGDAVVVVSSQVPPGTRRSLFAPGVWLG